MASFDLECPNFKWWRQPSVDCQKSCEVQGVRGKSLRPRNTCFGSRWWSWRCLMWAMNMWWWPFYKCYLLVSICVWVFCLKFLPLRDENTRVKQHTLPDVKSSPQYRRRGLSTLVGHSRPFQPSFGEAPIPEKWLCMEFPGRLGSEPQGGFRCDERYYCYQSETVYSKVGFFFLLTVIN